MRNPSAAVDERLRAAPFDAFRNLQALCESQAPDFHLIAGGVFDLADRSVYAQLAFHDGLAAIASSGIPVYLAQGPEDPAAAWLRPSTGRKAYTFWEADMTGSPSQRTTRPLLNIITYTVVDLITQSLDIIPTSSSPSITRIWLTR